MRKSKTARLAIARETLQRLDPASGNEMKQAAAGAVFSRSPGCTVPFTDWPTCDPIT
jgi:hypothetical protein